MVSVKLAILNENTNETTFQHAKYNIDIDRYEYHTNFCIYGHYSYQLSDKRGFRVYAASELKILEVIFE